MPASGFVGEAPGRPPFATPADAGTALDRSAATAAADMAERNRGTSPRTAHEAEYALTGTYPMRHIALMPPTELLNVLVEPTRRHIRDLLLERPRTVGELVAE